MAGLPEPLGRILVGDLHLPRAVVAADPSRPVTDPQNLIRGELPARLTALLLAHAEMAAAAAPWLTGDVAIPLTQLEHLAAQLHRQRAAIDAVLTEARMCHGFTQAAYNAAVAP